MPLNNATSYSNQVSARKLADQTVSNSTVLVNDTTLLFAVGESEVWEFFAFIYHVASAAADFKWNFTWPALGLVLGTPHGAIGAASLYIPMESRTGSNSDGAAAERILLYWGVYIGGVNSGAVQFQFAQVAAEVSNATCKAGSFIIARKLT